jgi:ribosomal protein S12 methylthiotransferase accessory factor YcaO
MPMSRTWDPRLQNLLDSLKGRFEVHELDLPESPVFIALAIPSYSGVTGRKPRLPAGRGLCAAQSVVSAAGESVELLASLAQRCDQDRYQFRVTDGISEVLVQNISDGPDIFMPAQRVYLDWSATFNEPLIHDADSNGCASASTWAAALNKALLECIERDAMAIWWYGRQSRQHIPVSCLDKIAPRLSWWLSKRQRQFQLIDITSDIGVPVVAAVSFDENGRHVAIGSAAAVNTERAITSALTEMIQMEVSLKMGAQSEVLQNWFENASAREMRQFQPCQYVHDYTLSSDDPQKQLIEKGHQIFAIDLTAKDDFLITARVIVPTLSALHCGPNVERILLQSLRQPQFGGIQNAHEIETLEPY